jgi:hypothetical protein
MSVSIVDGTIEEAVPGRSALSVRFFKRIVFRLADGGTKTVLKPVVHSRLAEHLQPGTSGRFYLYAAIDHRGVHGLRDDKGQALMHFPRNNEIATLIAALLMGLWVGGALVSVGGIPILPGLVVLLSVPAYFLYRNTRIEAERQFASDNRPVPPVLDAAPEPAVGA